MGNERNGLEYELVDSYYLLAGEDEPAPASLGIWRQQHRRYLQEHKNGIYIGMLLTGKLDSYLHKIDEQAEKMFSCLLKQLAENEGITDQLKAENQMTWVGAMNNIHARATEIVSHNLICT